MANHEQYIHHDVIKVGGSALFKEKSPHLDPIFVQQLIEFLKNQEKKRHEITVVVGGGELARMRKQDAVDLGVTDERALDMIGIRISWDNARLLADIAQAQRIPDKKVKFIGGSKPGQTTDAVAIESAIALQSRENRIVYMIGNTDGYLQTNPDGTLSNTVIKDIDLAIYSKTLPSYHPGMHIPLDPKATQLAIENDVKIIFTGRNIDNMRLAMQEKPFIGTTFQPR